MKSIVKNFSDEKVEAYHGKNNSKTKQTASQCFAAVGTSLLKFTFGNSMGFTTLLIAELYKDDAEIKISKSELTWFSSYYFTELLGALITGCMAQHIGSRKMSLISSAMISICWIIFYYSTGSVMVLGAQAIMGLFVPSTMIAGTTYLVEISEPRLRGPLISASSLFITFGGFFTLLAGKWLHWRTVCLLNLIFPLLGFFFMCLIPDSPHWLASKERFVEAEKALAWLRGWTSTDNVKSEFQDMKLSHSTGHSRKVLAFKDTANTYMDKSFYLPLATMCCVVLTHILGGNQLILAYALVIFDEIQSPIDEHWATIIQNALRAGGSVICLCTIHSIGKRKLVFASLVLATLSYLTASVALYLIDNGLATSEIYYWVAPLMIFLSTLAYSVGIDQVVIMLNGELFPSRFRNIGAGMGIFVTVIARSAMNKVYLYAQDLVKVQGVFLFFSAACVVGFVTLYCILPETEGLTLQQIDDYYAGVHIFGTRDKDDIEKPSTTEPISE